MTSQNFERVQTQYLLENRVTMINKYMVSSEGRRERLRDENDELTLSPSLTSGTEERTGVESLLLSFTHPSECFLVAHIE